MAGKTSVSGIEGDLEAEKTSVEKPLVLVSFYSKGESTEINDDSLSRSDSGSPASPNASDFIVWPLASKSADDSSPSKNNAAVSNSIGTWIMTPGSKRIAGTVPNAKEAKRRKVSTGLDEAGKRVSSLRRLWSEDDEIALLQSISDFKAWKGSDPSADMGAFYQFAKKKIHFDPTLNQLIDKMRRLKKKYCNIIEKGENRGHPAFSNSHELKCFEIAQGIWNAEAKKAHPEQSREICCSMPLSSKNEMDIMKEGVDREIKIDPDEFLSDFPWLNASFQSEYNKYWPQRLMGFVKENTPLIGTAKAKELNERWRTLEISELELYLKRVELVRDQSKLVMNTLSAAAKS